MARCEDYPCCGHTDGLPCDWVYVPGPHDGCDHNTSFCEIQEDDEDDDDDDEDEDLLFSESQYRPNNIIACPACAPFDCSDPDVHLRHQIPSRYTPLANRGCHCGADFDGRDCMCFEY